jgi:hypothetical protein
MNINASALCFNHRGSKRRKIEETLGESSWLIACCKKVACSCFVLGGMDDIYGGMRYCYSEALTGWLAGWLAL